MNLEVTKELLREELLSSARSAAEKIKPGKIAECLRKTDFYRNANRVYCGPSILLKQARMNILLDGKELIMPGPGMKEGFYLLEPFTVPFEKIQLAVTYKGLAGHGRLLDNKDLKKLGVSLLLDHVLTVDTSGYFLGDGKGFFDLALAILSDTGALSGRVNVAVVADCVQSCGPSLPYDPWDIQADAVLSEDGVMVLSERMQKRPNIMWDSLTLNRIRRITPLWKHYVSVREK